MPKIVRKRIQGKFRYKCFKPCQMSENQLLNVELSEEEIEAIRLMDIEKLYQEDCANEMEISRATFGRIISSARAKIADALIHGKILNIQI